MLRRTRSRATARICTRWPSIWPTAKGRCPAPGSITTDELRGFLSALHEAGYAKTSISRRLASVRSFLRSASAKAGPKRTRPRRSAIRARAASCRTFSRPTKSASCSTRRKATRRPALRDRAILETLYSAGLRVSELVGLNDGDLDFPAGIVRVRGKGKRERLAPIGSYAVRALKAWLEVRKLSPREKTGREAPVFTNRFGTRLTTRSVARMLEKYLKETGLDQRTSPHTLRHSFATHSSTAAPTSAACKNCLGHKSLVTTQIYTHVSTANLQAAYEKAHPRAR